MSGQKFTICSICFRKLILGKRVIFSPLLLCIYMSWLMGSGCGTDGRVVTSDTKGPLFETSQFLFAVKCTQMMKKRLKVQLRFCITLSVFLLFFISLFRCELYSICWRDSKIQKRIFYYSCSDGKANLYRPYVSFIYFHFVAIVRIRTNMCALGTMPKKTRNALGWSKTFYLTRKTTLFCTSSKLRRNHFKLYVYCFTNFVLYLKFVFLHLIGNRIQTHDLTIVWT